jgi:hypothetical protein
MRFFDFLRCSAGWAALVLGPGPALSFTAGAQPAAEATRCLLLPVDPALRARQAALVVEGQVLDAQGFWDAGHQRIFTRHRLRVFSVLKGSVADTTALTLITEGGRVGLDQQTLTNTLQLSPGQQGLFFLSAAPWSGLGTGPAWTPFASQQGLIAYDLSQGRAAEPFQAYPAIDAGFYAGQARLTGQARRVLQANPALAAAQHPKPLAQRGLAPVINSLAPSQLPAGAQAVLTIDGEGFGNSRGRGFVAFRNADDGGSSRVQPRAEDYVLWSDRRIQVRVPSSGIGGHPAGSGEVRVSTDEQLSTESTGTVTIGYALTNVESSTGPIVRPSHVRQNGNGGISFRFGSSFTVNTAAAASWQRALASWRCQAGMNWEVGSPIASNAIAADGQNVVAFDTDAPLPAQVLGRTTSYYRGCFAPDGTVVFGVAEIDMVFDEATRFQFGPLPAVPPFIDFESVVVHELGHAQQLGHILLPGAVMHYAVSVGQNSRLLSGNDLAGGRRVLRERSFLTPGCGGEALLPAPLTALTASYTPGTGASLSWTTRDECFLTDFVVERSLGADTTGWEAVGTVAAGQAGGQYQLLDPQPRAGLHYYRLRLARPGGMLDSAAPQALSTDDGVSLILFPNPVADDELRLQYRASQASNLTFRICDELGREHQLSAAPARAGLNVLRVSVATLRPGFYVLRYRDEQGNTGHQSFVRL